MSRASDKCQREKRKTINGDDLLWAMATLGFEDYIDPLKVYLTRYREVIFLFSLPTHLPTYLYCLLSYASSRRGSLDFTHLLCFSLLFFYDMNLEHYRWRSVVLLIFIPNTIIKLLILCCSSLLLDIYRQGDTKGSAKGGDANAKKDGQSSQNGQVLPLSLH